MRKIYLLFGLLFLTKLIISQTITKFDYTGTDRGDFPQTVGNAMVCIYDLNGRQLKCLSVGGRGTTSVQVSGYELSAGMYHYALIDDGGLVDTKTMILTQ